MINRFKNHILLYFFQLFLMHLLIFRYHQIQSMEIIRWHFRSKKYDKMKRKIQTFVFFFEFFQLYLKIASNSENWVNALERAGKIQNEVDIQSDLYIFFLENWLTQEKSKFWSFWHEMGESNERQFAKNQYFMTMENIKKWIHL